MYYNHKKCIIPLSKLNKYALHISYGCYSLLKFAKERKLSYFNEDFHKIVLYTLKRFSVIRFLRLSKIQIKK